MVLRDVAIGGCKIPLGKVCGSGSDELCVPVVTKKGKHRGDAYISLTFKAGTTKVGTHTHERESKEGSPGGVGAPVKAGATPASVH